jgi:hypothetical protein
MRNGNGKKETYTGVEKRGDKNTVYSHLQQRSNLLQSIKTLLLLLRLLLLLLLLLLITSVGVDYLLATTCTSGAPLCTSFLYILVFISTYSSYSQCTGLASFNEIVLSNDIAILQNPTFLRLLVQLPGSGSGLRYGGGGSSSGGSSSSSKRSDEGGRSMAGIKQRPRVVMREGNDAISTTASASSTTSSRREPSAACLESLVSLVLGLIVSLWYLLYDTERTHVLSCWWSRFENVMLQQANYTLQHQQETYIRA